MYEIIGLVRPTDGAIIGFTIWQVGTKRLQTQSIYGTEETERLEKDLARINEAFLLKEAWPTADDPEVQELLANPDFMPVRYITKTVIDEDNSDIVWYEMSPQQMDSVPISEQVNWKASRIEYKPLTVPDGIEEEIKERERVEKAREIVAKRRVS